MSTRDPIPEAQLTHVGVFVDDMDTMVGFYTGVFGMIVRDAGTFGDKHLSFLTGSTDEHHQLVLAGGRTAEADVRLLSQLSFRVGSLDDLRAFADRATAHGATALEARNHGNSWSIYFRDPEQNMVEMYCTTPWQVRQPWRVPLDLDADDADIVAETDRLIHEQGVAIELDEWIADTAARLVAHRAGHRPDPDTDRSDVTP